MSETLLAMAAACVLASSQTRLMPTAVGWVEDTALEVGSQGRCTQVDLDLPEGTRLLERRVRLRRTERGDRKIGEDHWSWQPPRLDGTRTARLHLPEMVPGDRARIRIRLERTRVRPYRWRPGADRARYAELRLTRDMPVSAYGDLAHRGRTWWTTDPDVGVELRVHHGDRGVSPLPTDMPQVFDPPPALPVVEALADMETLLLVPRGVDGASPLVGPPAVRRGAVDDRGFARSLVLLTRDGPDRVELGAWLPEVDAEGSYDVEEGEVAVWLREDGPRVLQHPDAVPRWGRVWTASGVVDVRAPEHPEPATPFAAAERDLPRLVQQQSLLIDLPPGDPQITLYPGGGSRAAVRQAVRFPADGHARPHVLDLPEGVEEVAVGTDPPGVADPTWTLRLRDADAALVVGPTSHPLTLLFDWMQDDAPACGALDRDDPQQKLFVEATHGEVVWDGDRAWHLDGTPVIPDRTSLVRGLERRFAARSLPEPALPTRLKHARPSWDLVTRLRPTLYERAHPGNLPQEPGWPRPLHRARRSGAVTPLEAALIVRLYAIQSGMSATWAMVRPAWEGGDAPLCPAAYPEALLRIDLEGESRWVDPSCTMCAPFEIRPHLEGAVALGPGVDRTPSPTRGRWSVEVADETVRWDLEGPAALRFREWTGGLPPEERPSAIAARMAGPGAVLVSSEGIPDAGTPILLVATRPEGPHAGADPLALPAPARDGTTWMDWVGERRLTLHEPPGEAPAASSLEVPGATWARQTSEDGTVVETLTVEERLLGADAARALRASRP